MFIRPINSDIAVSEQITETDLAQIAEAGFKTVINNRPDDESLDQPSSDTLAEAAKALGLSYHYLPIIPGQFTPQLVEDFSRLMTEQQKPVFAFCRSGTRSTNLWALAEAGKQPADEIINAAHNAGYDVSALRYYLEAGFEQE